MAQREHPPALEYVLMPDLNGFEVCRQLRANPGLEDTPVSILTAR